MSKVQSIVLTLSDDPLVTETYNPSQSNPDSATFVLLGDRFSENKSIKARVRPAAVGNTGHRVSWLGVRPIPAGDQAGCCVDKDNIPANTFTIETLVRKESSSAQADDLIAMIRAFVNSVEFADTVKGGGFYG